MEVNHKVTDWDVLATGLRETSVSPCEELVPL